MSGSKSVFRPRSWLGWIGACVAALLSACAPVDLLNATVTTAGLTVTRGIAYGTAPRQKLDIYSPNGAANLPAVMFIYGGSWQDGSRKNYKFLAASLAKQGMVVLVPDYRVYPDVRYPVFLQDCAHAAAWMQNNVARYGGDTQRMFLMGHSAGAYNAAMLALDPAYLADAGSNRNDFIGMIGLAGPYDFLPIKEPDIQAVFGSADDPSTQPITYVDGHNKPMLLLAGADDRTVYPRNTVSLATRIRDKGGPVQDKIYPDIGHIGIVIAFAPLFRWKAPVLADTVRFIRSQPPRATPLRATP